MDRVSSKTNDAYVEFMTKDDASRALDRFRKLKEGDKPPRLGDRTVQMFASGQDELMKERAMPEEKDTAHRLAAYSDAVFAVIVTIMLLELKAPDQLGSTTIISCGWWVIRGYD